MEPQENVDEMSLRRQTAEHYWKIGNYLASTCQSASRFYMFNLQKKLSEVPDLLKSSTKKSYLFCHHCGSIWSPENCKIRIQARRSVNCHIKKLLNLEANQPWKLNNHQKKKLRKFQESTNKIIYTCFLCKKKTVFPGSKKSDVKCKSLSQTSTSTPHSKVKLKKGDLNAGLFIPSPCSVDLNERSNLKKLQVSKNISEIETSPRNKSISQRESENILTLEGPGKISRMLYAENQAITPQTVKCTPECIPVSTTQKQSTSKKKKKTLLGQILNQEQNKKKKSSLSSFLVSL